ncbi:MAG TPA: tetratricopeptide repeat protein [Gemmatimonadales bacterium]|nr:tetratricopeptide repeat protein [Gemmatimonadales bacterium]
MEYEKICFIIMPFGRRPVGEQEVDFDDIYDRIFVPAVRAVPLPEGGRLEPRRTDRDFFSGDIGQEMFEYIEYSRFALADITGLNANVFYELGARHRAREAGTAIFRQTNAPIPFDVNRIKAFAYEYQPEEKAGEARALITRVLTESLRNNRLDSPVQLALRVQRQEHGAIEGLLREAENAIRNQDHATAIATYRRALGGDPRNPLLRMKLGLLLKEHGEWAEALDHFAAAARVARSYAEAHREIGIAENKLWDDAGRPRGAPDGEGPLREAVRLNPEDFDALSSLGGVLKRKERWAESAELYRQATEVSHGHPYPLLNEIKLQARSGGELKLDGRRRLQLARAERALRAQVTNQPPYNPPWCFFDLAEIRLYLGDSKEFVEWLDRGVTYCTAPWQPETFRESLQLLLDGGVDLPELRTGIQQLDEAVQSFD